MARGHPRNEIEAKAKLAVVNTLSEHDLTPIERVRLLSELIQRYSTRALRYERHGDYQTPADEAHADPEQEGDDGP